MNVFGYCRVSGRSQVEGDGFPRQYDALEAFCLAQQLNRVGTFREEGVSGTVEGLDRPAFAEMIDYIDERNRVPEPSTQIHAIVVERMDRLARDLMVSEVLLSELRKRGIKVFSTDQGNILDMASDGGDPTRVLIRQIMGALAQWEKSMLVKKLSAAKERKRAKGGYCGGERPYGCNPGEAMILRVMLDNHPELNYTAIAKLLNSSGCANRAGRAWKPQGVRSILIEYRKKNKQ